MADVLVLLTTAAFMAVCVGYVRWCDAIIGPDPVAAADENRDGGDEATDRPIDGANAIASAVAGRAA